MRINREYLLHKLQQVSPGLASREIVEQSASFVFNEGSIATFNDEVLCIADLECDIVGAVHAAPLSSLLSKLAEDELDISSNGSELLVKGKRSRSGIRMQKDILLPISSVELPDDSSWSDLHGEFVEALTIVEGSASKDDSTFNLTCIHVSPKYLEACDGYQLTRYKLKTGITNECLIKRDAAKSLIGSSVNQVSEGKNWIHFRGKEIRISFRKWIQDYVDLSQLISARGQKTTLPGGLAEAVDKAEIFSADNSVRNEVTVQIRQGRLRLKGEGGHGWYEERKKIEYTGEPISFMISPKLLTEITKRTNDCEITRGCLRIDAGKFIFVAALGEIEEKEEVVAEQEETQGQAEEQE
jgi:DNA polymerase III sliding clamp (beta) subunit (PCNA family)